MHVYLEQESLQYGFLARVANCMDKLFTFYLPAIRTESTIIENKKHYHPNKNIAKNNMVTLAAAH